MAQKMGPFRIFHVCVTDFDLNHVADRAVAAAGKRIGKTVDPSRSGAVKRLYLTYPWAMLLKYAQRNL
jgi:hypothetical protein